MKFSHNRTKSFCATSCACSERCVFPWSGVCLRSLSYGVQLKEARKEKELFGEEVVLCL